jgi:probable F420-dependent oxidoreductase
VKLGFSTMNTPEDVPPAEMAKALEDRGFDSFWIGEHSHIPTSRKTPYPSGGEMPEQYRRMMDPFVSLTSAAAATTTLRLGLGVALPLEHDVFDLAKTVTTLDRLSGGRVEFGVGVGWNEEELANIRPELTWGQRYKALAECVAALRALWTDEASEFHGQFFNFDPVWSEPKPLQSPHPKIWCGTGGRLGTTHAVEWADGWLPMDIALGDVAKKIGKFREAAAAAGRNDIPISIVTFGDPTLETLQRYRDLGVERSIVGAARQGWNDPATSIPFVDRYAEFLDKLA